MTLRKHFTPRDYQGLIINHILDVPRCGVWAGMGMGKTTSALTALDALELVEPGPALVTAPLRVAQSTWPDEAVKWDHLRNIEVTAIVGDVKTRERALARAFLFSASVFTINYENLPWLTETLKRWRKPWPFGKVAAAVPPAGRLAVAAAFLRNRNEKERVGLYRPFRLDGAVLADPCGRLPENGILGLPDRWSGVLSCCRDSWHRGMAWGVLGADMERRRITHVAIKYRGRVWALPAPCRHHHVIRLIGGIEGPDIQGFCDDRGTFLDRKEALSVALEAGQVKDPAAIRADQLFSEDLW